MNNKLFISIIVTVLTFGSIGVALAAPGWTYQRSVLPETDNAFDIGTTTGKANSGIWRNIYTNNITISGTCTGCGGGGGDPFTHTSVWSQTTSATSTLLALTGSPISLAASSTAVFTNASTTMFEVTGAATSTFAGPIDMANNTLTSHGLRGDATDGIHIIANNWADVASFGIANSQNSIFYGGVNIDGATRLATSLTGLAYTSSGAVTAITNGTIGTTGVLGLSAGVPAYVATSTLYGAVQNGKVLAGSGDSLVYIATTTFTGTAPISLSYAVGQVTGSCATASSGVAGCLSNTAFDLFNNKQAPGFQIGTSTITISQLAYYTGVSPTSIGGVATTSVSCSGSTTCTTFTAIGASPITISSTGGGTFPFTATTNYGAAANSTSTPIWFTAGMMASTTNNYFAGITIDSGTAQDAWTTAGASSHEWSYGAKLSDSTFRISSSTTLGTSDALTIDKNLLVSIPTSLKVASLAGLGAWNAGTAYAISTSSPLNTAITGNAGTATALASAPTNCAAGYFTLGINTSGTSQNCTYAFATTTPWSAGLLTLNSSGLGYSLATSTTALLSLGSLSLANSSSTQMSITSTGHLYIPSGTDPTISFAGDLAINTTAASSSLRYFDGTAERSLFPDGTGGLPFASSTLAYMGGYSATGTTTIKQIRFSRPMSLLSFYCDTDVGTAFVTIGNGTASTTGQCTGAGILTASTVTFTMGQVMYIGIGTSASAPNIITVSPQLRKDAD